MPPPSSPHPPWGWTPGARVLLGLFAAAGGIMLLALARDGRRPLQPPPPPLVVDLNTAPPAVLRALPRLGPVLVDRIVVARAEAPFRSLEDFDDRVKGIGPATLRALRPHVRVVPADGRELATPRPRLAAASATH